MNVPASLRSDQVAVMPWIGWSLCTGLGGRNGMDQVAGITGMRTGSGLHLLQPKKEGRLAVKVSGNWRITFRFKDGDAYEVNYEDYH